MFVGFPRLGARVAVARTSAAVITVGSEDGTPEAVIWAVARKDWIAFVTDTGSPPTGAHREIDRLLIPDEIFMLASISSPDARLIGLFEGQRA